MTHVLRLFLYKSDRTWLEKNIDFDAWVILLNLLSRFFSIEKIKKYLV